MTALALPHDRRAVASPNGWPYPLVVRRARGSVVEDLDGNRYLDFTAGALATVAGHAHPMVVRAIQEQVERMAKGCSGEFTSEPLMALARKLAQLAPTRGDNRVLFANNRMQSLEAVLKMARRRTRRNRVITFDGNSHNRGLAAITLDLSRPHHRRRIPPAAWVVDSLPYGSVAAVHDYFRSGLGEEVAVIFAGANGYLDDLPVAKVSDFEKTVLSAMRGKYADVLADIAREKALSDDIRARLKAALDSIKKTYAA